MENSEALDKVINLGKLFVKELKLEPGVDTFSRWMAHYLAEKMSIAEQSEGEKKEAAEKECFDAILKLWQHRNSLPSGRRPFQSFKPIFEYLSNLNPEIEEPLFFDGFDQAKLSQVEIGSLDYQSVKEWINVAKDIDKTAKVWLEYALSQAATYAENERTKEWLENAVDLQDNADTGIIRILLDKDPSFDIEKYDKDDFSKKYEIERLKNRISQLQKYSQFNEALQKTYEAELEKYLE